MSLSSFSPRPTSGRSPSSSTGDDEYRFAAKTAGGVGSSTSREGQGSSSSSSPLSHPTLLGQFLDSTIPNGQPLAPPPPFSHQTTPTPSTLSHLQYQHLYVLPVLLLEFLAIALTRAVLPSILLQEYGSNVYLVLGSADCIRGLLAFFACPLFGKLSDILGRRLCLFITVLGSCAPVCSLAFFTWDQPVGSFLNGSTDVTNNIEQVGVLPSSENIPLDIQTNSTLPPMAIPIFIILLSLSGIFSSTFTLVFAYISDSVHGRDERVSAYGLALATFGLSFTIGPMAGGYLANYRTDYVFQCTLALTVVDLIYIYWILPESKKPRVSFGITNTEGDGSGLFSPKSGASVASVTSTTTTILLQVADSISWSPWESLKLVLQDPFLRKVGQVAFFYYTGLWAVISTLSLYAVQHFRLTPERLGELMSVLGLSTMVAEAVLVRVMVPLVGEKRAIRIGLMSFALQCLVLGGANAAWQLFICVGFSLLGNLVYPSLSSLVSGTVPPESVGEALGAINGIKALTEGIGPLFFGALMTVSEHTQFPGSPYWLAGLLVLVAYRLAGKLPANSEPSQYSSLASPDKYPPYPMSSPEEEYIHELEFKRRYPKSRQQHYGIRKSPYDGAYKRRNNEEDDDDDCLAAIFPTPIRDEEDEEYQALLSEIEESDEWEDGGVGSPPTDSNAGEFRTPNRSSPGRGLSNTFPSMSLESTSEEDLGFAQKPAKK